MLAAAGEASPHARGLILVELHAWLDWLEGWLRGRLARGLLRPPRRHLRLQPRAAPPRRRSGSGLRRRHRRPGCRRALRAGQPHRRRRVAAHRARSAHVRTGPRPPRRHGIRRAQPPDPPPTSGRPPMSSLLYRLGRWCAAHAWRTLAHLARRARRRRRARRHRRQAAEQPDLDPRHLFEKVSTGSGQEIPEAAGGPAPWCSRATATSHHRRAARRRSRRCSPPGSRCRTSSGVINPFEAQDQLDKPPPSTHRRRGEARGGPDQARRRPRPAARRAEGQLSAGQAVLDQLVAANPDDPSIPGPARPARGGPEEGRARPRPTWPRARPTSPRVGRSTRTARP